jgi:hypothetical protein
MKTMEMFHLNIPKSQETGVLCSTYAPYIVSRMKKDPSLETL